MTTNRSARRRLLAVLLVAGLAGGCSSNDDTPASTSAPASSAPAASAAAPTSAAPSSAPPSSPTSAADPVKTACTKLDPKSQDWAALKAIGEAVSSSADFSVSRYGKLLRSNADLAIHAQGAADEASMEASATRSAESLKQACVKAGLTSG